MKKIFVFLSLVLILEQQLLAKEITVCNGNRMGKNMDCRGNYSGKTNLVALYKHGWRLITVVAISDVEGGSGGSSVYTNIYYTYYLER